MSDKNLTSLRPHGWLYITDADGRVSESETHLCCHCGGHFVMQKGSGRLRGFCTRCNGLICGPACANCVPAEQLLENIEAGRAEDYRRIIAAVPVEFDKVTR